MWSEHKNVLWYLLPLRATLISLRKIESLLRSCQQECLNQQTYIVKKQQSLINNKYVIKLV